jgi:photosystem II stability/assembly factor-like uncharacterized protein
MFHKTVFLKVLLISLLILLCISPTGGASAGGNVWSNSGPEGGQVSALAIDPGTPTTLYVATLYGGLFKSTDSGGTWNPSNSGLTTTNVSSLAIDPDTPTTIYAGTWSGAFKSTDSGGTWNLTSTGLTSTKVSSLTIDPATPTTIYAGTDYGGGGIFKSTDGGANWHESNNGLSITVVHTLVIDPAKPTTLYAGIFYGGVFKSTDGGENWSATNASLTDLDVRTLAIDPITPTTLYAGTTGEGIFKSTDSGENWETINTGLPENISAYALAIDPVKPTTLYVGLNGGGVFKSTDGGENWSEVNAGLNDANIYALAINSNTPAILYAGTMCGGVFKSTNSGDSWSTANTGLIATNIYTVAIDPVTPSTLYTGTYGGGVFKSIDSGGTWSASNAGLTNTFIGTLAIDLDTPTTLYAGTLGGGVFNSTDGGGNWTAVNNGLPSFANVYALAIEPGTPTTVYAGIKGGMYKSTDSGGTWNASNTGLTATYVYALAINPTAPAILYAGTNSGVFASSDSGGTWNTASTGLTATNISVLTIDPKTPTTIYAGTTIGGVFKSMNSGGTWSAVNTGLTTTYISSLAIDPTIQTVLYAGTLGGGVFRSINSGANWSAFNAGLTSTRVSSLAIDQKAPANLYAGTGRAWAGHAGVFSFQMYNPTISGSLGTNGAGATVTYTGGSTTADGSGTYSFTVPYDWSGTVTPSKTNFTFSPTNRAYANIVTNQTGQDYTATYSGLPPSIPLLLSPLSTALVTAYTPTLDWSDSTVPNGTILGKYEYQVARDNAFTTLHTTGSVATSQYLFTTPLEPNTTFYWHVRACNTYGTCSTWSLARSFRTILPPPALTDPLDGSNLLYNRPTFDWNDVTGASSYTIQIARDNTFTTLLGTYLVTPSTYTPGASLPANVTLYWRVLARGTNGPSTWSTTRSINTANPPSIPALLLPAINALTTDYTPRLDWAASIVPTGTTFLHYQMQLDDNSDFSSPVADQTIADLLNHAYTPASDLLVNTKYYWRIRSFNTDGEYSSWSSIRYFRTALPPPTLTLPSEAYHALNNQPIFDWDYVLGATSYTIQISKNDTFTLLVGSYTTIPSTYTPGASLPANFTLYWRVQTRGENGPSSWSAIRSINTANPPTIPTLLLPALNALITSDYKPRLDWSQSIAPTGTNFKYYQVQVDDNADFSSPVLDQTINDPLKHEYTPASELAINNKYYWRVRAYNTDGEYSSWSHVRYFRTAILPPDLSAPSNTFLVPSLRPTFTWNVVTGASGYTIQVSKNYTFTLLILNTSTTGTTNTQYTPTASLPVNITLYWRARANGINGPSLWSPTWLFTTPNPPATPLLVSPASSALLTDYTPTLKWSKPILPTTFGSAPFDYYQIQIATDAVFAAVVQDANVNDYNTLEYTASPELTPNTRFYWRVRAWDTLGHYSVWSTARYFRTTLNQPILISPANASLTGFLRPTFDWGDVTGTTGYTIQVSKNNTFTLLVINATITTTNSQYTPAINLPTNIPLYWRVRANGTNGPSLWSAVWSLISTP